MASGMESDLEDPEYLHAGLLVAEYNQIKSPNQSPSVNVWSQVPSINIVVLLPKTEGLEGLFTRSYALNVLRLEPSSQDFVT